MLNLRLVQPQAILDLSPLPDLSGVQVMESGVELGACLTHACIEDGCVPGRIGRVLAQIARGIAYRTVRNRGTVGGSLVHADPSADWVTTLCALGGVARISSSAGLRQVAIKDFFQAAFETCLEPYEVVTSIFIPNLDDDTQWGYAKICRKTGEFAHAMAAVWLPASGEGRVVVGATESRPLVIERPGPLLQLVSEESSLRSEAKRVFEGHLMRIGLSDPLTNQVHLQALKRATQQAQGVTQ